MALLFYLLLVRACTSGLVVPLHGHGTPRYIGLSTRGPSAFRVRFMSSATQGWTETPMVGPDKADAPFWTVPSGRGIASAFGSLVIQDDDQLVLSDKEGSVITSGGVSRGSLSLSSHEARLYGRGAGLKDATRLSSRSSTPLVANRITYVPYYFSTDGYAALASTNVTSVYTPMHGVWLQDQTASLAVSYSSNGTHVDWQHEGSFELYLMPAGSLAAATQAYYALCGAPRLPPLYVFGFLASRWGWKNRADVEQTLSKFRSGHYPLDAWISDFEWITPIPDYVIPYMGIWFYKDFGFQPGLFPSPKENLAHDRSDLHVRFGGIRKPRVGNMETLSYLRKKDGWLQKGGIRHAGALVLFVFALAFAVPLCCSIALCRAARTPAIERGERVAPSSLDAFRVDGIVDGAAHEADSGSDVDPDPACVRPRNSGKTRMLALATSCLSKTGEQLQRRWKQLKHCLRRAWRPGCKRCLLRVAAVVMLLPVLGLLYFVLIFWSQRTLDFTLPEVREWYSQKLSTQLEAGVDFWWNDEGEIDYFTYHWWNVAETMALRNSSRRDSRFFSLNRAFTPGMARLGATAWTGDIYATWESLAATPGTLLNWGLAGAPYVACDIGGFAPETEAHLLVRWYQLGIFLPIMRVHSTFQVRPRWPWLWGEEPSRVMRQALELRHRLLAYHYSLAHAMFRTRLPWMRALAMEYPSDEVGWEITSQWMDGDLLVAPVLNRDSRTNVYLPEGIWHGFNCTAVHEGPVWINGTAGLHDVPVFVRAGALIPLNPLVQYVDALLSPQTEPLELHIYGGKNGTFDLAYDDGYTVGYERDYMANVLITRFDWEDTSRILSWKVVGSANASQFKKLSAKLFDSDGRVESLAAEISGNGSLVFSRSV